VCVRRRFVQSFENVSFVSDSSLSTYVDIRRVHAARIICGDVSRAKNYFVNAKTEWTVGAGNWFVFVVVRFNLRRPPKQLSSLPILCHSQSVVAPRRRLIFMFRHVYEMCRTRKSLEIRTGLKKTKKKRLFTTIRR